MRIVIALGGNALLQRGQPMTAENQRANIRVAAERIAGVVPGNEVVIAHGNGPQVGLLALQSAAYPDVAPYPLDVLGAQTEAMIGYVIEQELGNLLPFETPIATMLTMIEVDPHDPAFDHPTKPIGPVYDSATAERRAREDGWAIAPDGDGFRRVVASPEPRRIFELRPIRQLLENGHGGDLRRRRRHPDGVRRGPAPARHRGRDRQGPRLGLLAEQLEADLLVIATDVDGVYADWGTPEQARLGEVSLTSSARIDLPAGFDGTAKSKSRMRLCANHLGNEAAIGSLHRYREDLSVGQRGDKGARVMDWVVAGGRDSVDSNGDARRVPHALPSDRPRQHRAAGDAVRLVAAAVIPLHRRIASLTGPLGIALVVLTWGAMAVARLVNALLRTDAGWFRIQFRLNPAERYGVFDSLYVSLVTIGTLGFGDIVPTSPSLRVIVPLEALFGFMLLTAAVSWVLQIYPALHRRRVLALQLSTLREARRAKPTLGIDSVPISVLTGLAAAVVEARNDFTQYGATYYFRDLEADASLASSLDYATALAAEAAASARPQTRLAGALIAVAVDSLTELLNQEFLQFDGDTAAVIKAYAADHRHTT